MKVFKGETKQNPFLIHKLTSTYDLTTEQANYIIKMVEVLGNAHELASAVFERSDDEQLLFLAKNINK